jgi:NAD-dependent deacetylase
LARPDVVWFGEGLDAGRLQASFEAARNATIMLVIGTSAIVHPAAQIPIVAKQYGALVYEFNPNPTPLSEIADAVYREPAATALPRWWSNRSSDLTSLDVQENPPLTP